MTFQLEIRKLDDWVPVTTDEDPLELVSYARTAKKATGAIGHRIFKADRKRLKSGELAGGPRPANGRRAPGVRDVVSLAKDAAEHIIKTKQKAIHVYPISNYVSIQFRKHLFGNLTGRIGDGRDRVKSEEIAVKEFGYTIIEIEPEIYE